MSQSADDASRYEELSSECIERTERQLASLKRGPDTDTSLLFHLHPSNKVRKASYLEAEESSMFRVEGSESRRSPVSPHASPDHPRWNGSHSPPAGSTPTDLCARLGFTRRLKCLYDTHNQLVTESMSLLKPTPLRSATQPPAFPAPQGPPCLPSPSSHPTSSPSSSSASSSSSPFATLAKIEPYREIGPAVSVVVPGESSLQSVTTRALAALQASLRLAMEQQLVIKKLDAASSGGKGKHGEELVSASTARRPVATAAAPSPPHVKPSQDPLSVLANAAFGMLSETEPVPSQHSRGMPNLLAPTPNAATTTSSSSSADLAPAAVGRKAAVPAPLTVMSSLPQSPAASPRSSPTPAPKAPKIKTSRRCYKCETTTSPSWRRSTNRQYELCEDCATDVIRDSNAQPAVKA